MCYISGSGRDINLMKSVGPLTQPLVASDDADPDETVCIDVDCIAYIECMQWWTYGVCQKKTDIDRSVSLNGPQSMALNAKKADIGITAC